MNFKGWKKIADNNDSAVFEHEKGPKLTVAKKTLSKQHLEALKNLPLHAAEGDFVEDPTAKLTSDANASSIEAGLPVEKEAGANPPESTFSSRIGADADMAANFLKNPLGNTLGAAIPPQREPAAPSQAQQEPDGPPESLAEPQVDGPPAPKDNPEQKPQPTQVTSEDHFRNLNQEAQNFSADLQSGHIQPETMQDLYGKKDTMGKIGTLFGLLLSGAGSGLSHQPNALLQVMNNEINNDLDAQKATATNKQNLLRLNIENEFNKARIGLTGADTQLAKQNALIAGTELTRSQLMLAYLQKQMKEASKMSNTNPQKAAALQTLNGLGQVVDQEIQQNHAKAASQMSPINYGKLNQLEMDSQLKIPVQGANPEAIDKATKEAATVEEARSIRNDFNNSFNKLNGMIFKGEKVSPHQRAAYVNALSAKLAKQSAGRFNLQEAHQMVEGMFPSLGDWKETANIKFQKAQDYFDSTEAATPTLNRLGLKNPLPEQVRYDAQGKAWTKSEWEAAHGKDK